ncbi:MAG: hypothetical protein ACD_40C00006G0001 [uncultured bacterium]|nr:MAG: hypothetical protein ACD_40C00006G0001 [uncultured bacterium]KKU13537.1 MAG: hypothetical protein UX21_C0042G0007 [Microgenomates group bacterium GW2011_GWC2_45_8]KKU26098.1 MAG: hypothetical protein UX37_C0006G0021 [Microgenomates group bacterium GW2011_GWA2_46_16]
MTNNLLINALSLQNPWWSDPQFSNDDSLRHKRDLFQDFLGRVTGRELITSLVGLRRVGKSTLIRQTISRLLDSGDDPRSILYFLFEEQSNQKSTDVLRQIIEYQISRNPKKKSYLFLDEIQYINGWNSTLKYYFDLYPQLKFVVSGSASLFIHTQSSESLAGRIQELVLRPMGYGEYLRISEKQDSPENFQHYLSWGEFPYLEKLPGWSEKKEYVLDFVLRKVVEYDLPRLKRFYGNDLTNMLNVLISHSGQNIEIQNLAHDLGLAQNTTREYLSLLEKTHLISQVFNLGIGFRTRSTRMRKVYASSVNAIVLGSFRGLDSDLWQSGMGNIIETFVYNYLSRQSETININFWRERQVKEVDFLQITAESKLPIEVKYQNQLRESDLDNILTYCRKERLSQALVVTKYAEASRTIDNITVVFRPAHLLA